jgi:hypothetical protein
MILTLVFMLGRDQLYAIEPVIPLSHKQPDPKKQKQITHFPIT